LRSSRRQTQHIAASSSQRLLVRVGHTLSVFYSTYAAWIETEGDREKIERAFGESKRGAKLAR
jgi:hypothetical protein